MLNLDIEEIIAIDAGAQPTPKIVINYSMGVETYTENDYLAKNSVFNFNTSTNEYGVYSLSNISVNLLNRDYYFSRLLYYELPIGKLAIIYYTINDVDIEMFRGKISENWLLTEQVLTINISV